MFVVLRLSFEADDGVEGTLEMDDDLDAFLYQLQDGVAVLMGAVGLRSVGTEADNERQGPECCAICHDASPLGDSLPVRREASSFQSSFWPVRVFHLPV